MPLKASSRMTISGLRIVARRKRRTRCAEKDISPKSVSRAHSTLSLFSGLAAGVPGRS